MQATEHKPNDSQPEETKVADQKIDDPKTAAFKSEVIDQVLKVTLIDKRVLYGKLICLDNQKNIVLADSIEQIPEEFIAPVNKQLAFHARSTINSAGYIKLGKEESENAELMSKIDKEFGKDKFYLGQVIVQGKSIAKIEIQRQQ